MYVYHKRYEICMDPNCVDDECPELKEVSSEVVTNKGSLYFKHNQIVKFSRWILDLEIQISRISVIRLIKKVLNTEQGQKFYATLKLKF